MQSTVFYDGAVCPRESARIPLCDRSVFFADAIYDAALAANGHIAFCQAHTDRFFRNAEALGIPCPLAPDALTDALFRMLAYAEGEPCFLYFQLSRHAPARTHVYPDGAPGHLLITVDPISLPRTADTLALIGVPDERYGYCHIKTVGLLPNVLAAKAAERAGADEAVFLRRGRVTECAHSNVSLLKDGVLQTHPANRRILPGIGRARLLAMAKRLGIPVRERSFTPADLLAADEVLVTSTSKLCMRVSSYNGLPVGKNTEEGKRLCRLLEEEFYAEVALPCPAPERGK